MISDSISEDKHFEFGYSHSNALLQSRLKLKGCKGHKATHHPMKCDVINDIKLFPTGYTCTMLQKQVCWALCVQCMHIGMLSL